MAAGSTDSSHACRGSTRCSPAVAVMPRTIIRGHNSLCGTRGCKFVIHVVRYTKRRSEAHSGGGLLPGREGSDLAGANTRGQKQVRPKQGGTYRQEGLASGRQRNA